MVGGTFSDAHTKLHAMVLETPPSTSIDLPVFVINLDESRDRWAFIAEQLNDLQIPKQTFTRVPAVNGREMVLTKGIETHTYQNDELTVDVDATFGCVAPCFIACTLSHIRAIGVAYDAGHEFAVISEDDVSWLLSPFWEHSLRELAEKLPKDKGATIALFNVARKPHKGLREIRQCFGTQAYIINRQAMETVLSRTSKERRDKKYHPLKFISNIVMRATGNATSRPKDKFYLEHSPMMERVSADYFIYNLAGARWSVGETYVYPYNRSNRSTLQQPWFVQMDCERYAHRSLRRAMCLVRRIHRE
jgi:GR25 family glycosyltransferase involved in LPS biosynthesis